MLRTSLTLIGAIGALTAASHLAEADPLADACRAQPTRACVLEVAKATAEKVPAPYWRASGLAFIAASQQRAGLADRAAATMALSSEVAKQIPPDFPFGTVPIGSISMRATMGDVAGALELARGIENPQMRSTGLASVAAAAQRLGRAKEAKAIFAQAIEAAQAAPDKDRSNSLTNIAVAEARVGLPEATATFDLAIAADKLLNPPLGPTSIISQRIEAGEYERAYTDITDMPESSRNRLLKQLVAALANAGKIEDAETVASSIYGDSEHITADTDIAVADYRAGRAMAGAQTLGKAQILANTQTLPSRKAEALAAIAGAEAVGHMDARSKDHLAEARKALDAETDNYARYAMVQPIAMALARSGQLQEAINVLRSQNEPLTEWLTLRAISFDLLAARQEGEAFAAINGISRDDARGSMLLLFAEKLTK